MKQITHIIKAEIKMAASSFLLCTIVLFSSLCSAQTTSLSPDSIKDEASLNLLLLDQLKSSADTIYLMHGTRDWILEPMVVKNIKNKTIIFDKDLRIMAKKGAFQHKTDALFKLLSCENINFIGNGANLRMNKSEYTTGEWRHAICLRSCKNISISDMEIYDSGGDGIYIAGREKGSYSENILLRNLCSSNNRRQGLSIISAKNVLVEDCVFENTNGTLPEAGVDLEPNTEHDRIEDIKFRRCTFKNNHNSGIKISVGKLTANSRPISIDFEECHLFDNHKRTGRNIAAEITISAHREFPVKGKVSFERCLIENSDWGLLYSRKLEKGFHVSFIDCAAIDIAKKNRGPIYFEVPDYDNDYGPLGGFTFTNMLIESNTDKPFMQIRGSFKGTLSQVKNISGNFTLKGQSLNSIKYFKYDPANNDNVDIKYVLQSKE